MSKIPDSKMQAWLKATSSEGKGQAVLKRVQLAGEFCERTCRLSETETLNSLSGIDFSSQVLVVRLPKKAYVQYRSRHPNKWFTDTGLTPDQVGIVKGERQRELFFQQASYLH